MQMVGDSDASEHIEEMLRTCKGTDDMWEIIEQCGHSFGKKHVVSALYQLGLFRRYETNAATAQLTHALVDRLVLFRPGDFTAEEATNCLWALATLEEVRDHIGAHRLAIDLGEEACRRFSEFAPAKMAIFASSLSRLIRTQSEDAVVGKIIASYSEYVMPDSGFPRFPPEELRHWSLYLQESAGPALNLQKGGSYGPAGMKGGDPRGLGQLGPKGAGKGFPPSASGPAPPGPPSGGSLAPQGARGPPGYDNGAYGPMGFKGAGKPGPPPPAGGMNGHNGASRMQKGGPGGPSPQEARRTMGVAT